MSLNIREAKSEDAARWLELAKLVLGDDHPAKQLYDLGWIIDELSSSTNKTWIAEKDGVIQGSLSILGPSAENTNPVLNIGRNLFRPEAFTNGAAETLLRAVDELNPGHVNMQIARVLASDNPQQILFEKVGYVCVGYQPFKHLHSSREGVLFYVKPSQANLATRMPMSESLPQMGELAGLVLGNLRLPPAASVRDGVTGYPLQTEVACQDVSKEQFDAEGAKAISANPSKEISGAFNLGFGYMRTTATTAPKASLGSRDGKFVGGICYYYDEQDRCVRIIESFSTDDLSMGAMLHHVVKLAQNQMSAVYVEMDVLVTAPRLLKSAEQLGFVPIAFLPAFHTKDALHTDVVKLVKLNMGYALENTALTAHAQSMVKIIDNNFQDQKIGIAIINLLRGLPIFDGLADGELRKIARLFTQKLYRPAEKVFNKGDSGKEAYIVMRGQVDICLEEGSSPIASVTSGQIFGELAFLDGSSRGAHAIASQASILLVIQRSAFNDIVQREPHLGMVVMRNIAMDLSNKLRKANTAMSPRR